MTKNYAIALFGVMLTFHSALGEVKTVTVSASAHEAQGMSIKPRMTELEMIVYPTLE